MDCISKQYPEEITVEEDEFLRQKQQQEAFMTDRRDALFGRDDILKQVSEMVKWSQFYNLMNLSYF